jgi:arginyl-tRNA synthetase
MMVEYSQPNTHKAFHVGHMRNAALGNALINMYEQIGHEVVGVNYFGDEGAHIAKCLWKLKKDLDAGIVDLADVPVEARGEFLGNYYSTAVQSLALTTLTSFPHPGVMAVRVESVGPHPDETAPKNWHCVVVSDGEQKFEVVCGGNGYKQGDIVAYTPVGGSYKGKPVEPRDMKGKTSNGVIFGRTELGLKNLPKAVDPDAPAPTEEEKAAAAKAKKKGKKKKKGQGPAPEDLQIYVMPAETKLGAHLTEIGRVKGADIAEGLTVMEEYNTRMDAVKQMLRDMEDGKEGIKELWEETKQWSLTEFKRIYEWLEVRFDHDFFESEVSESSKAIVQQAYDEGKLTMDRGAIVADLTKHKLGFCVLLKSSGAGLYATKDLALAKVKFDQFKVDRSMYVVDCAQTLHFAQVFKVLEMLGYEQAKKCFHLPYGVVVTPAGKMSSREGTVIAFNDLAQSLKEAVFEKYFKQKSTEDSEWSEAEVTEAVRAISVATIKYGMLNTDAAKDIVFRLEDWISSQGNTGPYMLYAYARVRSILRDVSAAEGSTLDPSALTDAEKPMLVQINKFWSEVDVATGKVNPGHLCSYLFDLSKSFSSWYRLDTSNIKKCTDPARKASLLALVDAVSRVIKRGLHCLGISTIDRM